MSKINNELLTFLKKSPTAFHAVKEMSIQLEEEGYHYVDEGSTWKIERGGKYYTTRNGSSIIAFHVGSDMQEYHYQVTSTHSDSPAFKVKEQAELKGKGDYLQLNTEGYGGMIASSWFDRPLSLAGRVLVREGDRVVSKLMHVEENVLIIPNVAIHLNREINNGYKYNLQVDTLPLMSAGKMDKESYREFLANQVHVNKEDILGHDVFVYNRDEPIEWGIKKEFISAARLDNLQCTYATLRGFIDAENPQSITVFACFDNEEVGSSTKQGAGSTFLYDVLHRIHTSLGYKEDEYYQAIAKSFMVSCDNAHALHPNHPELSDSTNCNYLNKGIVIKYNANQRYTTDAISNAVFVELCKKNNLPYQSFTNRSDMVGGSTLGNISSTKVSMHTIDVGLPQLAMHSAFETAGSEDSETLVKFSKAFFEANIDIQDANTIHVN